jgi:hypothetical protein
MMIAESKLPETHAFRFKRPKAMEKLEFEPVLSRDYPDALDGDDLDPLEPLTRAQRVRR